MDTVTSLLVGLLLSCIGMGYFWFGKKQRHKSALWCGILLMVLPYFFDSWLWLSLASLGLMFAPKYVKF